MRLAQIARELQISPNTIAKHLEKTRGLTLEKGFNEKLDDEILEELRSKFKVEEKDEVVEEDWSIQEKKEEVVEESVETLSELEGAIEFEEKIPENVERIKAIIPELEGIKVVGKIDLPEPKAPEIPEAETEENGDVKEPTAEQKSIPEKRERRPKREVRKRPVRTPLSDEEKEAREEKRKLKERERFEAKRKEARKTKYLNSVQQKAIKAKDKKVLSAKQAIEVKSVPLNSSASAKKAAPNPSKPKKDGFLKRAIRWLYHGE